MTACCGSADIAGDPDGDPDGGAVDERIDALYDLPPGEFTAARAALARALRADGARDAAARVGKLRRPTVAAWAVNQAVRRHRDRMAALLEAGDQVRRAQRRAMSGVRGGGLRDATRARRRMIDEMTELAVAVLTEQGSNAETHRGDIAATFDAASADDDAAAAVQRARLAAPVPVASGFGSLDGLAVLPSDEPAGTPTATPAGGDRAGAAGDDAADAAAAEDGPGAEARRRAQEEQQRAAQRRRDAMRAVEEARRAVARARTDERQARRRATARSAAADQAARAAGEAERTWRRLQREAEDLRGQADRERARADEAHHAIEEHEARLRDRRRELDDLEG